MGTDSNAKSKRRLGRGLGSLIGQPVSVEPPASHIPDSGSVSNKPSIVLKEQDNNQSASNNVQDNTAVIANDRLVYINTSNIKPNPHQPRQDMDQNALQRLAGSIREAGVMQPVILKPKKGSDEYELVAGERRWRAAKLVGLENIPAIIRDVNEETAAQWALIENLQREDLNPIERAEAFQHLIDKFGLTQSQVADRTGLDRSSVSNILRINSLDNNTKEDIRSGRLSLGHAKVLLSIQDPVVRRKIAESAIVGHWSVRELERRCLQFTNSNSQNEVNNEPKLKPQHILDLENELSVITGLQTQIRLKMKRQSGDIILSFGNLEDFESFLEKIRALTTNS